MSNQPLIVSLFPSKCCLSEVDIIGNCTSCGISQIKSKKKLEDQLAKIKDEYWTAAFAAWDNAVKGLFNPSPENKL